MTSTVARSLLCVAILAAHGPARAQAPEREWTAVLLLAANYDEMEERLSWTGSSDDVNVLVLHDMDGAGINAYRMLPDTNQEHAPGECCPGTEVDCCITEALPLADMGIDSGAAIYDPGVLASFFDYVVENFPARHYLVSLRGQMNGPYLLRHNEGGGMTIVELGAALTHITEPTGRRIDILNFGFCLSALADWAYALRQQVDYLVASANFTDEPVATRWRFYLWVRRLIQTPLMAPRDLAIAVPEIFADTGAYCAGTVHQCTNTNPPNPSLPHGIDEPWTCSTLELSRIAALAAATRALVCAVAGNFAMLQAPFEQAFAEASFYGYGYGAEYGRPDLQYLAERLAVLAPALAPLCAEVGDAVEAAVIANRFQQEPAPLTGGGWFDGGDNAHGLTAFVPGNEALATYESGFGDFGIASLWRLLASYRLGAPPSVDDLQITPAPINLQIGDRIEVEAESILAGIGATCPMPVDWDATALAGVAVLEERSNPAVLVARAAGRGELRAYLGGREAAASVVVTGSSTTPPSTRPRTDGSGCECKSLASAWGLLLVVPWLARRSRRRC